MQNAETVLGVLRERGRKGLPCEELYRQMFNPQLYLLAWGRAGCRSWGRPRNRSIWRRTAAPSSPASSKQLEGDPQPAWRAFTTVDEASRGFADEVGYPVLVRPSYVLSGQAMRVIWGRNDLGRFLSQAARVSPEHPVVITKFIEGADEVELDAISDGKRVLVDRGAQAPVDGPGSIRATRSSACRPDAQRPRCRRS